MKWEMDPIRYTSSFSNYMHICINRTLLKQIQRPEHGFATLLIIESYPKRYSTFMDCTPKRSQLKMKRSDRNRDGGWPRLCFKSGGDPIHFSSRSIVSALYNVGSEVHYLRDDQSQVAENTSRMTVRDVVLCEETLGTSDKKSTGNFAQITQSLLPKFPPQAKHNFHYDKWLSSRANHA